MDALRAIWRKNERFLADFEEVERLPKGTWPRGPEARERALAAYEAEQKAGREAGEALFDRFSEALAPLAAALASRGEATIEITVDSQHLRCSETFKIARGGMAAGGRSDGRHDPVEMDKSKDALRRRLFVNGATGATDHQMRLTAAQQGHARPQPYDAD